MIAILQSPTPISRPETGDTPARRRTYRPVVAGSGRVRRIGSWRAECGRGIVPADGSREEVIVREGYAAADISRQPLPVRSFLAYVATILEMPIEQLPQLPSDGDPATGWAGLAVAGRARAGHRPRRRTHDVLLARAMVGARLPAGGAGSLRRHVRRPVRWDPGDGQISDHSIQDGFVLAATDLALAVPVRAPGRPRRARWTGSGSPPRPGSRCDHCTGRGLSTARALPETGTPWAPARCRPDCQVRHRLSRVGNRRPNHALHMMAVTQIRQPDSVGVATTNGNGSRARPPRRRCAA